VAIAIAMNGENAEWDAYDEGRMAERILIAASALGLGAGIGWALEEERPQVADLLGLIAPAFARTIISLGYPTEAAWKPRSAPGDGSAATCGACAGALRTIAHVPGPRSVWRSGREAGREEGSLAARLNTDEPADRADVLITSPARIRQPCTSMGDDPQLLGVRRW
jgi:nitroreductase